jgi:hypothetical protein
MHVCIADIRPCTAGDQYFRGGDVPKADRAYFTALSYMEVSTVSFVRSQCDAVQALKARDGCYPPALQLTRKALLLNLCACRLASGDLAAVIEHSTTGYHVLANP